MHWQTGCIGWRVRYLVPKMSHRNSFARQRKAEFQRMHIFVRQLIVSVALLLCTELVAAAKPMVAAGSAHSLLLAADGVLWAWGRNDQGQVGDGSGVQRSSPVQVASGVAAIAAGGDSSFALMVDGSLWAWGGNASGQLGDGTTSKRLNPIRIGDGIRSVASNGGSTFATKLDASRWAWGNNDFGQLGDGSKTSRLVPTMVNVSYAGVTNGECHGAAIDFDGSVWTWGCSAAFVGGTAGHFILGQRGNGYINTNSYNAFGTPDPAPALLGGGYVSVSTSVHYNVALKGDGSLWIFGFGDFRDHMRPSGLVPTMVGGGFSQAAQGAHFTVALKSDGSLWTWGINTVGQLADGGVGGTTCRHGTVFALDTVSCRPDPAQVATGFRSFAVGAVHAVAIKADGSVWSWGGNDSGQLGDGSTDSRVVPVALGFNVDSALLSVRVAGVANNSLTTINSVTGHGGFGSYSLKVNGGTAVSLIAPVSAEGRVFSHWAGCDRNPGDLSFNGCELTMPQDGDKRVTAVYTSATSKAINISTRAKVLLGDNVLIAGFIISGGPKTVLVKALGPTLSALGVPGVLSNPMLTLYAGQTPIASNDDWGNAAEVAAMRASGRAPASSAESAILVTLNPGAYTAIVQGVASDTGIGLVSVDDMDPLSSDSRLINISSRAYVSTGGDDQMIVGFVIQGGAKTALVSGLGPSMLAYGVTGAVSDPAISLYSGQTMLNFNDDWSSAVDAAGVDIRTTGRLFGKEAAIYRELPPGAYTVIMRGVGAA